VNDVEKARAAHAALVAAKAACDASCLSVEAHTLLRGDALAQIVSRGAAHVASMERRAIPISIGDEVSLVGFYDRRDGAPCRARLVSVGRTLIRLDDHREYRLETGRWNNRDFGGHHQIDPDDLARILRDLAKKPSSKRSGQ
jgi:hypothetical protein